ncbi:unnamed protein product, partial [Staurois parvus]
MIGTSHRSPVQLLVLPGSAHKQGSGEDVYKRPPTPALLPSGRLYTWAGQEVV